MVGDITYIPTWRGWLYLALVIDCATRKIVGWAMDDNYKTPLITKATRMAARNVDLPEGAIFHSDRGSNYTSAEYAGVLEGLGIRQSVGRTGIYDNALSESVNGTLKVELVHRTAYPTRQKVGGGAPGAGFSSDTPVDSIGDSEKFTLEDQGDFTVCIKTGCVFLKGVILRRRDCGWSVTRSVCTFLDMPGVAEGDRRWSPVAAAGC